MVLGVGFEPTYGKPRQIYSLLLLTVQPLHLEENKIAGERIRTFVGHSPADLQSAAFDRSATPAKIGFKNREG
jgi:hypothetical protein